MTRKMDPLAKSHNEMMRFLQKLIRFSDKHYGPGRRDNTVQNHYNIATRLVTEAKEARR